MIEYLSGAEATRPTLIDKVPAEPKALALFKPSFEAGTITLGGPKGDVTLRWTLGEGKEARGVPPGTYRLRTTRVERKQGKDTWLISSTGLTRDAGDYKKGTTTTLAFDDRVHFTCKATRKRKALFLGMGIKAATGQGLSIYKDTTRLRIGYTVLDAKGKALAAGKMKFG